MVVQKTIKLNEHYVKKKYNTPNKNVVTNSDGTIDFEDKIDIDAIDNAKEDKSNKIKHYNEGSLINGQGTDDQYVSAKALYELLISPQSAVTNGHSHGTIYIDNIPLSHGPRPFTMIGEQKIKLFEHLMFDYENDLSLYYLQGDERINFNDFALKSEIPSATVATTGSYNDLIDKPTTMTPSAHTSSNAGTYGAATTKEYGHVKLSTSISSSETTGVAATPSAVRTAFNKGSDALTAANNAQAAANAARDTADYAQNTADSKLSTVSYSNGKLNIS
jgi:hypothetical protein